MAEQLEGVNISYIIKNFQSFNTVNFIDFLPFFPFRLISELPELLYRILKWKICYSCKILEFLPKELENAWKLF